MEVVRQRFRLSSTDTSAHHIEQQSDPVNVISRSQVCVRVWARVCQCVRERMSYLGSGDSIQSVTVSALKMSRQGTTSEPSSEPTLGSFADDEHRLPHLQWRLRKKNNNPKTHGTEERPRMKPPPQKNPARWRSSRS